MKTKFFLKNNRKAMAAFMFAASMPLAFTACSDQIDNPVTDLEQPAENNFKGFGTAVDTYNINDAKKEFTAEDWRGQQAIYIYDGQGSERDTENKKGYTKVALPWLKSDVLTNLPNGFCDDITPANGWELVLNRCGSRNIKNNNFFAIYNKYSGILRFFFYMPDDFSSGNDHVWEVTMTDNLAKSTALRYGRTEDCEKLNKGAIGLSGQTTISEYVAPWVEQLSSDGLITPNCGWWAFDVDLSTYSGHQLAEDDNIRLQMRSMHVGAISLNSQIQAAINGTIQADIDLMESQHLGNSLTGIVSKIYEMGKSAYEIPSALDDEKWGDALGSAFNIGKKVANLCGIKTEASRDIQGKLDGTISLNMDGTITTEGMLKSSEPTTGVVSPTFFLKDFDLTNAPALGEGIWNLESAPVVYYTNAQMMWENHQDKFMAPGAMGIPMTGIGAVYSTDKKSPFGGQHIWTGGSNNEHTYSDNPYTGIVSYFDPSTIKLVLNPKVFSPEEIANARVFATCGVRKNATFGSTDNYRQAMNLAGSSVNLEGNRYTYLNPSTDASPFDALSSMDDKLGMTAASKSDIEKKDGNCYALIGRGDDGLFVEPQVLYGGKYLDKSFMMPAYEVNVTVVVEHNGLPMVYSRTYLPQYKFIDAAKIPALSPTNPLENKPANYVADIYEQQVKHISDIRNYLRSSLQPVKGTQSGGLYNGYGEQFCFESPQQAAVYLIDGDPKTKWSSSWCSITNTNSRNIVPGAASCTSVDGSGKPVWALEFKTNFNITPHRYTLTTASDNALSTYDRPKEWALYGQTQDGKWQLIDKRETTEGHADALPKTNLAEKQYYINYKAGQPPQFTNFRFEVYSTFVRPDRYNTPRMNLAEFRFDQ